MLLKGSFWRLYPTKKTSNVRTYFLQKQDDKLPFGIFLLGLIPFNNNLIQTENNLAKTICFIGLLVAIQRFLRHSLKFRYFKLRKSCGLDWSCHFTGWNSSEGSHFWANYTSFCLTFHKVINIWWCIHLFYVSILLV